MQSNWQIKASFHVNYLVGKLYVVVQKSKVKTTSELRRNPMEDGAI